MPAAPQPLQLACRARPPLGPGAGIGGALGRCEPPAGGSWSHVAPIALLEGQVTLVRGGDPIAWILATPSISKSLSRSIASGGGTTLPPSPCPPASSTRLRAPQPTTPVASTAASTTPRLRNGLIPPAIIRFAPDAIPR